MFRFQYIRANRQFIITALCRFGKKTSLIDSQVFYFSPIHQSALSLLSALFPQSLSILASVQPLQRKRKSGMVWKATHYGLACLQGKRIMIVVILSCFTNHDQSQPVLSYIIAKGIQSPHGQNHDLYIVNSSWMSDSDYINYIIQSKIIMYYFLRPSQHQLSHICIKC